VDANSLRNQAAHLLALACTAREGGYIEYADQLTELASEALARAEKIERRQQQATSRPAFRLSIWNVAGATALLQHESS
jgi:hypothetical protein